MFFKRKVPKTTVPRVIGICGSARGCGVTQLCVASAGLYASSMRLSTALFEAGQRRAIGRMATEDTVLSFSRAGFTMRGFDCFPELPEEELHRIGSTRYDRILVDLQDIETAVLQYRLFDRLLLLGGTEAWNYEDFERAVQLFITKLPDMSVGDFAGRNASEDAKKRFRKEFGRTLRPVPQIADPFRLDERTKQELTILLGER